MLSAAHALAALKKAPNSSCLCFLVKAPSIIFTSTLQIQVHLQAIIV